jgi:hypothetical protein
MNRWIFNIFGKEYLVYADSEPDAYYKLSNALPELQQYEGAGYSLHDGTDLRGKAAGAYDPETNTIESILPVTMQDGRRAPGA